MNCIGFALGLLELCQPVVFRDRELHFNAAIIRRDVSRAVVIRDPTSAAGVRCRGNSAPSPGAARGPKMTDSVEKGPDVVARLAT